jgi:hypothetical protein
VRRRSKEIRSSRQGQQHNKEEEDEKGQDRDQVESHCVDKRASRTRDQIGFIVWMRSQVGPAIVLVIKGGRARASNHPSQGIEAKLGLKEVK